jgi:hypothetical protein
MLLLLLVLLLLLLLLLLLCCCLQVAKQQGEYIADLLVTGRYSQLQERLELPPNKGPFK